VNVLLDTCALINLANGDLPKQAMAAFRKAPAAYVSSVSPWEIAIKSALGKLQLNAPPLEWFTGLAERYDLREIPVDSGTASASAALPFVHRDPFDRVIVALAQSRGLVVLTSDQNITSYPGVTTLW
jgi:PIN domain nuclease of toxin-antitoxin system